MRRHVQAGWLLMSLGGAAVSPLVAQRPPVTYSDSTLIRRILTAEDRRDPTDRSLAEGARHGDARIQLIARRALSRITDSLFVTRDSAPAPDAPPTWPEPAWRLRYRALTPRTTDCAVFRAALTDSAWPVRLRAADIVPATCASDQAIVTTIQSWFRALPTNYTSRRAGTVSWHSRAHAMIALAKLRPAEAATRVREFAVEREWHLRLYAARAAALLSDTVTLRRMAGDRDPNVREAVIESLSRLAPHVDDELFIDALNARDAQVVRAAAAALAESPHPRARAAANAAFQRWVARANASERDVRLALLTVAGRPASDDRPPPPREDIPSAAVALALGEEVQLRVVMSPESGGGSFVVRMRGDVAPITAARIVELVRRKYYNGLAWHRVEADFVIQGGSPGDNEYVGLAQYFRDEVGTVPHVRGTVGMSTRGHDSGDAQWFVNLRDNLRLGRDYTVFAEVIEGIEVVDGILEGDVIASIERLGA